MTMPTIEYVADQARAYFEAVGLEPVVNLEAESLELDGKVYGLSGLAARMGKVPPVAWPEFVRDHFDRLMQTPEPDEIEAILSDWGQVSNRVEAHVIGDHERQPFGPGVVAEREIAPGLSERLNFPIGLGAYASIKADQAESWPISPEVLWLLARSNVRQAQPAEVILSDERTGLVGWSGRSILATITADNVGQFGKFFTIPERDRALVLPVREPDSLEVAMHVLTLSLKAMAASDRPVSPNLYWQGQSGMVYSVASPGNEGRYQYHRHPEFASMCWALEEAKAN